MTTNADFFAEKWEAEQGAFRRVLAALPADKLDYRPHERSTSAGDLAWQLAIEQRGMADLAKSSQTEWDGGARPGTLDEILTVWDRATEEMRETLKSRDDAKWDQDAQFIMKGAPVWTTKLRDMLWGFLFDMVHHRGQLSSYIRPMGGKVPAIYGPSADSE
ncbi:MAG TPA: DinB family protein [Thermoanaerobaculia bacterium]|nr:DinB family protein [Thermoanaerobaculia bacterium]